MKVKHKVDGKEYEIRSGFTERGAEIRIFSGDREVGPRYSITWENGHDFKQSFGQSAEAHLIEIAKDDLDRGIYR